jgi:hypothetical protein
MSSDRVVEITEEEAQKLLMASTLNDVTPGEPETPVVVTADATEETPTETSTETPTTSTETPKNRPTLQDLKRNVHVFAPDGRRYVIVDVKVVGTVLVETGAVTSVVLNQDREFNQVVVPEGKWHTCGTTVNEERLEFIKNAKQFETRPVQVHEVTRENLYQLERQPSTVIVEVFDRVILVEMITMVDTTIQFSTHPAVTVMEQFTLA